VIITQLQHFLATQNSKIRTSHRSKKAQADTTNAATLVAIIAALIIIYLLFLPPDIRQEILDGNSTNTTDSSSSGHNNTLLNERPGHLSYLPVNEYTHDLPAFSLYKITNSETIKTQNPFMIRNAWFDKSFKRVTFKINDVENTDNLLLSFRSTTRKGKLTIKLNDAIIYEDHMPDENSPALSLSKDLMQENNYLDFEVNGVGLAFWATNEYNFQDMKIVGDVTDLSRQESMVKFVVSTSEKYNVDKATIKFNPDCQEKNSGILDIYINAVTVYSAVPDCKVLNSAVIPTGLFETGENTASFKTNKGSYVIDNIKIVTKLKDATGMVYYFDIDSEQNKLIQNSSKSAVLEIKLVKTDEIKEANIIVNGHTTSMRTDQDLWTKTLQKYWLMEGSNYIKIDPKTEMDLAGVRIDIK